MLKPNHVKIGKKPLWFYLVYCVKVLEKFNELIITACGLKVAKAIVLACLLRDLRKLEIKDVKISHFYEIKKFRPLARAEIKITLRRCMC